MEPKRPDHDFSDEIQAHIRLEADRLREQGMSEEQALATARRAFGNVTGAEERFHESRRWLFWDAMRLDLRFAVRLLRKTPGWTAVAALTVALGIGATAAIFSIVNTVLLRPLPFAHPEQLYAVTESTRFGDNGLAPDYFVMRENMHKIGSSIVDMAAFDSSGVNWTTGDRAERLVAGNVTASFFPTLRVQPLLGRVFLPEEDRPGAGNAVILSYRLWRQRFNSDPKIVGQRIRLDREAALVVGVMPAAFEFQGCDLWRPSALDEAQQRQRKAMRIVTMVVRADAQSPAVLVNQELDALLAVAKREYPVMQGPKSKGYPKNFLDALRVSAKPLQEQLTGKLRPALLVFSGAVGLMLLIVCFTVANLMLARATARQREIAVRIALGSPRMRIVSQVLTESLLVSLAGGVLGLGLAWGAVALLNGARVQALTGLPIVSVDASTSLFAVAVTVLTGLLFGMAPALSSLGFGVRDALKRDSRGSTSSGGARRTRQALVVAQLGLSLTLLIGAGLLAKSFYRLRNVNPGFNSANVLTARINLTGPRYAELAGQREFVEKLLEGVSRMPGVEHAAIGALPPGVAGSSMLFRVENQPPIEPGQEPRTAFVPISVDYFQVMQTRLIQGRMLSDRDNASSPLVVLANEAFARKFLPGESALGHRISTQGQEVGSGWAEIVGVVGDIRQSGFDQDVEPTLYRTYQQEDHASFGRTNLLVRTSRDPMSLTASIEKMVTSIDRDLPMFDAKTMEQRMSDSLGSRRFNAALTGSFALAAMFLASIGVYGVMSYLVTLRTSELGIRLALGARRGQVLGSILREGAVLALLGAALGVGGALALSGYLRTLLYDVGTRDVETFVVAVLALCGAVIAACAIPGRRAAGVDPATALRCD